MTAGGQCEGGAVLRLSPLPGGPQSHSIPWERVPNADSPPSERNLVSTMIREVLVTSPVKAMDQRELIPSLWGGESRQP